MVLSHVISSYEFIPNSLRFALPSFVLLLCNMCNTLLQIGQTSFFFTRLWALDEKVSRWLCHPNAQCKEIKLVSPKGNQSWIFIRGTEAEARILWPPDAKNWLIGKDPDAGEDWRQEEKGMAEDEVVGWHHWLHGREFEESLGVGDGQGSLACCSPWGHKVSDMTEQLNWTELNVYPSNCSNIDKYFKMNRWITHHGNNFSASLK